MAADYEVCRVGDNRAQQKQFISMLWELYRGDANWVPPLIMNQQELVGFRYHPFYDENRVENFLVRKNGKVAGRVSAILNKGHNQRYDEKRGFFGFFECIDDTEAAQQLFAHAGRYLAEEHGMTDIRGPVNPSLNHEVGCLVEGFDTPPTFMMTYNPPAHEESTDLRLPTYNHFFEFGPSIVTRGQIKNR